MGLLDTAKKVVNYFQLNSAETKYRNNASTIRQQLKEGSINPLTDTKDFTQVDDIKKYLRTKVENGELIPIMLGKKVLHGGPWAYVDMEKFVCFCAQENIHYKNEYSVTYGGGGRGRRSSTSRVEEECFCRKGDILAIDNYKENRIRTIKNEELYKSEYYDINDQSSYNVLKEALNELDSSKTPEDVMQTLIYKRKASRLVQNDSLDDKLNSLTPDAPSTDSRDNKNREDNEHDEI